LKFCVSRYFFVHQLEVLVRGEVELRHPPTLAGARLDR
jgi:hypothetical protein